MASYAIEIQRNKGKGMRTSIIIHLLLLLIAWFYIFPVFNEPDPPIYAVTVDFSFEQSSLSEYAQADVGKTRPKADPIKSIEPTEVEQIEVEKPDVEMPEPTPVEETTPPITTDAVQDESPVEAVEDDMPVDDPEPEPIPQKPAPVVKKPSKPVVKTPTTPTGTKGSPDGKTTGKDDSGKPSVLDNGTDAGTGKGNTGKGPGDGKGNDNDSGKGDGGAGTGQYDGSGDGIFGRKVIYRNTSGLDMSKSGIVSVKTCINRAGRVSYAEVLEDESTITDRNIIKKTMNAAYGYKFQPDLSAPQEQCGKLVFRLDINTFMGN
jgi:hypothetical protein